MGAAVGRHALTDPKDEFGSVVIMRSLVDWLHGTVAKCSLLTGGDDDDDDEGSKSVA